MPCVRCGEQRRVALDVAGRATAGACRPCGRQSPRPAPGSSLPRLVYRHAWLTVHARCISSSTSSRASASACGGRHPAVPARAARRRARAPATLEIDFNGTDYSFLRAALPFLLAMLVLAIAARADRRAPRCGPEAARRADRGAVVAAASSRSALGALLFAGSLADAQLRVVAGLLGGVACAAVAHRGRRARCSRGRAPRLDRPPPRRAPALRRRRRAGARRAVVVLLPPVGDRSRWRCCCGCWSPAAGARARSTPACASSCADRP